MYQSVQVSRSVVSDSVTLWTAVHQVSLFFTNSRSLLKLMSIESAMPSPSPLAYNLSQHQGIPMYTCISVNMCIPRPDSC